MMVFKARERMLATACDSGKNHLWHSFLPLSTNQNLTFGVDWDKGY